MSKSPDEMVKDFLRGQNLEQVGKIDEAIELYEAALVAGFDSAGPYDRLIWIYQQRKMHTDVIRVAEASLKTVRTYPEKQSWYKQQIEQAQKAMASLPEPRAPQQ